MNQRIKTKARKSSFEHDERELKLKGPKERLSPTTFSANFKNGSRRR